MARRRQNQLRLFEGGAGAAGPPVIDDAPLVQEARRRYLHYALSVITSRALPDVRDGLKPVQRRILFTMYRELRLRHDAKPRKCAAIVGDVMGKYHPHGDTALYDALVRLAQPFVMRAPLVEGHGNFGSPDGDAAAAMRYTEARLQALADELLRELGQQTVAYRPSYDAMRFEPVVLPARFPNLLVNGSQGIAVGMATSIPPHNLGEVVKACVALIDDPELSLRQLLRSIRGPDFPTGGELLGTKGELAAIYACGQGTLKLRATWRGVESRRGGSIVIDTIPYGVERGTIVKRVADVIVARKLPGAVDVRDESTEECRIVIELRKDADPQLVMAYLYKHTPLASNVQVNLTCLVPTANPDIAAPSRVDLLTLLRHFLAFRMEVVTKRLQYELDELLKRIHVLEGLEIVFDALDEAIRIIRRAEGRQDAAGRLMKRFDLDQAQVDAILELRLYRLAQLEILMIRKELKDKRKDAARIAQLLESPAARWKLIRAELLELADTYRDPRRTRVRAEVDEPEYDAEAYIVQEDAVALLTQQGWIKRQREVKDLKATRMRDGDSLLDVAAGSTKACVALFSNQGSCYVCRVIDIPATSGYGVPVQKLFKLGDGERIVAMLGLDSRVLDVPEASEEATEPEAPFALAVTRRGLTLRFSLRGHRDPSTRSGRKFMRVGKNDEVLYVGVCDPGDPVACVTQQGRAVICDSDEIALLSGPGKGVILIRLQENDAVIGARVLGQEDAALVALREGGKAYKITTRRYQTAARAGKGYVLFKRGSFVAVQAPELVVPQLEEPA